MTAAVVKFVLCFVFISATVAQEETDPECTVRNRIPDFAQAGGRIKICSEIVSGEFVLRLKIDPERISDLAGVFKGVLPQICELDGQNAYGFQDVKSFGKKVSNVTIVYDALPKWGLEAKDCARKIRNAVQFKQLPQLIAWQVKANTKLSKSDTSTWEVYEGKEPVTKNTLVWRNPKPVTTTRSPAAAEGETTQTTTVSKFKFTSTVAPLPNGETTAMPIKAVDCAAAGSPCLCATLGAAPGAPGGCRWGQHSSGGYRCFPPAWTNLGYEKNVSCHYCPMQDPCPVDPEFVCNAQVEACTCVSAGAGCYWDTERWRCSVSTGGRNTSCASCSRQSRCVPPRIVLLKPANLFADTEINITYDRPVRLTPQKGYFQFWCQGDKKINIEGDAIQEVDGIIRIDMLKVPNNARIGCNLVVQEGAVTDLEGVATIGMGYGLYSFYLGDTLGPAILFKSPPVGSKKVKQDIEVVFQFDELLKPCTAKGFFFNAYIVSLGFAPSELNGWLWPGADNKEVLATLAHGHPAVKIRANKLMISFAGLPTAGRVIGVELEAGFVMDETGNGNARLLSESYMFSIKNSAQESTIVKQESQVSASQVLVAIGVLLVLCMLCGISMYFFRERLKHFQLGLKYAMQEGGSNLYGRMSMRMSRVSRVSVAPSDDDHNPEKAGWNKGQWKLEHAWRMDEFDEDPQVKKEKHPTSPKGKGKGKSDRRTHLRASGGYPYPSRGMSPQVMMVRPQPPSPTMVKSPSSKITPTKLPT
eukprot:TRINITY_DN25495_c0_g1_i1.p1 TRINITY_DN25495_c0_g1~~TRINITY_DN25495_c0_g1_i1.p1  ORF type:complete len:756 (-),score=98.72 TRINITY_DN25495_c0_g1_i1:200-2467(-)